ncbi:hypothetical protein JW859_04060 [bacterium]|nr:hypothetical protein [bacterium]
MKKIVGYFEGTDPNWLTSLNAQGYTTLPLSNGFDGHGMNVAMLSVNNRVDVVLAYLHKLMPAEGMDFDSATLLHATTVYEIPVLIACPMKHQDTAKELFGTIPPNVQFVDPAGIQSQAEAILQSAAVASG